MSWQAVIEVTVKALGYELVETERTPGGLLRVYIDRMPGDPNGEFIVVEDCERVTHQLQQVLEVENCSYERLEVSSPGLDRLLRTPADYARFVGQRVNLTLKAPFKGRKRYHGRLTAREDGWRLLLEAEVETAPKGAKAPVVDETALDFQLEEVREARLVPELDFKGRRFLPTAPGGAPRGEASGVDGGRER